MFFYVDYFIDNKGTFYVDGTKMESKKTKTNNIKNNHSIFTAAQFTVPKSADHCY